jgi:hypothetical protein
MKMREAIQAAHMEMRNSYNIVVGKPGGKEPLGRFQA